MEEGSRQEGQQGVSGVGEGPGPESQINSGCIVLRMICSSGPE